MNNLDQISSRVNAAVVHIERRDIIQPRTSQAQLEEAMGLAEAIDLNVIYHQIVPIQKISPSTLIHKGNVEAIASTVQAMSIKLVIINAIISPIQHRNLERTWKCKVIDRTGLILEIFGARAKTSEGRLQVELAALRHQRSRLVRSWTHLERQRGGFGFTGGPGEKQIELDRRLIDNRILKLQKELDKVQRMRGLHRHARKRQSTPVIALVGYTNAGKSTLFNLLTKANVLAANMLFATLDPAMRPVKLPNGKTVLLSDTVGFISELPTQLIAAFRATLEEVCNADIILHVRDCAHPDSEAQNNDVRQVLKELEIDVDHHNSEPIIIDVFNKFDLLNENEQTIYVNKINRLPNVCAVSAQTGYNIEELLKLIGQTLNKQGNIKVFEIPCERSDIIAWCYRQGFVVKQESSDDRIILNLHISKSEEERLKTMIVQS